MIGKSNMATKKKMISFFGRFGTNLTRPDQGHNAGQVPKGMWGSVRLITPRPVTFETDKDSETWRPDQAWYPQIRPDLWFSSFPTHAVAECNPDPFVFSFFFLTFDYKLNFPSAIPHYLSAEDEYKGYRLPAGSIIIPNTWCVPNLPPWLHIKSLAGQCSMMRSHRAVTSPFALTL